MTDEKSCCEALHPVSAPYRNCCLFSDDVFFNVGDANLGAVGVLSRSGVSPADLGIHTTNAFSCEVEVLLSAFAYLCDLASPFCLPVLRKNQVCLRDDLLGRGPCPDCPKLTLQAVEQERYLVGAVWCGACCFGGLLVMS